MCMQVVRESIPLLMRASAAVDDLALPHESLALESMEPFRVGFA